jgi:hypothetical protein
MRVLLQPSPTISTGYFCRCARLSAAAKALSSGTGAEADAELLAFVAAALAGLGDGSMAPDFIVSPMR